MGKGQSNTSLIQVSVVCPVYNAERFVRRAVESAHDLNEVAEIILVDDAGPDDSFSVCQKLESEFPKVRLIQHEDNQNHGAGASRNLGITNSRFDYVAFLDADDYYLPCRFEQEKRLFDEDASIDGVYGAIGVDYDSEDAREAFLEAGYGYQEFLTLTSAVPPEELIDVLFSLHPTVSGAFSTIAITVRKALFEKSGLFNENLRLRQDIHLWRRMAATGSLVAGSIDQAVAIRGVHDSNRMTNQVEQARIVDYWWRDLQAWFYSNPDLPTRARKVFDQAYGRYRMSNRPKWERRKVFLSYVLANPRVLSEAMGFFDVYIFEVFGRNWITLHLVSAKNRFTSRSA